MSQPVPMFLAARAPWRRDAAASTSGGGAVSYPNIAGMSWIGNPNMPTVSGSTLTYYPNYPTDEIAQAQALTAVPGTITSGAGWAWNTTDKAIYVTGANATLTGLDIDGQVIVQATGVTIQRCRVVMNVPNGNIYAIECDTGTTVIQDCDIRSNDTTTGTVGTLVVGTYTIRRCSLWGAENGLDTGPGCSVTHCYIDRLYNAGAAHADCIQMAGGVTDILIQHNTLLCRGIDNTNGTGAVNIPPASTGVLRITVQDNLVGGGSYTMYGPQSGAVSDGSVKLLNNKFTTHFNSTVGEFGPSTDWGDEPSGAVSGNVYFETGLPVTIA